MVLRNDDLALETVPADGPFEEQYGSSETSGWSGRNPAADIGRGDYRRKPSTCWNLVDPEKLNGNWRGVPMRMARGKLASQQGRKADALKTYRRLMAGMKIARQSSASGREAVATWSC